MHALAYWTTTVPLLQTFEKHVPLTGGAFPEPWWAHICVSLYVISGPARRIIVDSAVSFKPYDLLFFRRIPRLTLISLYCPFDLEEKDTDVGVVISVVPQAEDLVLYRMSRSSLLQERES